MKKGCNTQEKIKKEVSCMGGTGSAEKINWWWYILKSICIILCGFFVLIALGSFLWSIPPLRMFYDRLNEDSSYETLIHKTARIKLYNGGKVAEEFDEATITFASPKSETITFTAGGKKYCWQNGILIELKEKEER
ncbi:hypothetical protein HYT26_02300, partial [Candidatus Pacearchaeota archaeon]|nr:hypothetical protein [Candidatus Pacearchaeota archaeon]